MRNGANYLRETLDCIAAQTLTDFEVVISDNDSNDETTTICEEFASRDPRFRLVRQDTNLGAAANYDFVFHESRGRYFKWCAHDDLFGPTFLRQCVAALEQSADAVGALPVHCHVIDARGSFVGEVHFGMNLEGETPEARFGDLLRNWSFHCSPFFSLFRRSALVGSGLHGSFTGSDRVLVAEMLLKGPIARAPDTEFLFRDHADQYTRQVWPSQTASLDWLAPGSVGVSSAPLMRVMRELVLAVARVNPPFGTLIRALRSILGLIWRKKGKIAREVVSLLR